MEAVIYIIVGFCVWGVAGLMGAALWTICIKDEWRAPGWWKWTITPFLVL